MCKDDSDAPEGAKCCDNLVCGHKTLAVAIGMFVFLFFSFNLLDTRIHFDVYLQQSTFVQDVLLKQEARKVTHMLQ